jgi:hypothetical protein
VDSFRLHLISVDSLTRIISPSYVVFTSQLPSFMSFTVDECGRRFYRLPFQFLCIYRMLAWLVLAALTYSVCVACCWCDCGHCGWNHLAWILHENRLQSIGNSQIKQYSADAAQCKQRHNGHTTTIDLTCTKLMFDWSIRCSQIMHLNE